MGNSGNSGRGVCNANANIARVNCYAGNEFGSVPFNHCMAQADRDQADCIARSNGANNTKSHRSSNGNGTQRSKKHGKACRG